VSGWLQLADVILHSGRRSTFKIECDDLTDDEVAAACALLVKTLPPFGSVSSVPTGGLRMEEAMLPFATSGPPLIIDDVWTTGGSVVRHREAVYGDRETIVAVLFARGAVPLGVTALFTMHEKLWTL
jgi:orotate phosphoribosyltransferase